jgi:Cytidine and deoxycytidylate deaminase zinc-binding region
MKQAASLDDNEADDNADNSDGKGDEDEDYDDADEHYMHQALIVARNALHIGEVPVGCVIVMPTDQGSVIVSHGANQVNATRDGKLHVPNYCCYLILCMSSYTSLSRRVSVRPILIELSLYQN